MDNGQLKNQTIMKERYYLTYLAGNLERAIHCPVGMEGLKILLHGWLRRGIISPETLRKRERRDTEAWLTVYEAMSLSEYAGYDLT